VLFAYFLAGDTTHWSAELKHLQKMRRAIALDRRGHGRSESLVQSFAGELAAVSDRLGIARFASGREGSDHHELFVIRRSDEAHDLSAH
jgi:pimeloyl-ACP methyl ester carboxylesterase